MLFPDKMFLFLCVCPPPPHPSSKVLANVTVALAAMGVGALGLPLDLSNLVGGVMVLVLAAFGRFLLNGTRIPFGKQAEVCM